MNYWKIEFNDLPSLGQYYDSNTEIRIRTMTVRDVKYLATFNKSNAITITNELLNRCLKLKHLSSPLQSPQHRTQASRLRLT